MSHCEFVGGPHDGLVHDVPDREQQVNLPDPGQERRVDEEPDPAAPIRYSVYRRRYRDGRPERVFTPTQ